VHERVGNPVSPRAKEGKVDGSALRERITSSLLRKIEDANYPSVTMLNRVEAALTTPDDLAKYAEILIKKVESTEYPSTEMLNRLDRLIAALR
jgi:hypothetical protein